jgi:hypothetical protein
VALENMMTTALPKPINLDQIDVWHEELTDIAAGKLLLFGDL